MTAAHGPRFRIRLVAAGFGVLLLAVLIVHSSPVRRMVLRRAVAEAAERFGVTLQAEALRYNLATLRVSLTAVSAAASGAEATPFFTADLVEIDFPRGVLFGAFALDELRLQNARLAILRRADGTTNLPPGSSEPRTGDPAAIPIGRLEISPLAVNISDEAIGARLDLPAVNAAIGPREGTIQLARPGLLEYAGNSTPITALEGGLVFDGRTVRLDGLALTTPETQARAGGTLALLVADPSLDLTVTGNGDLARVIRWIDPGLPVTGAVTYDARISGPFDAVTVDARLGSERVTWDTFELTSVSAQVSADAERVRVPQFGANAAGGRVSATLDRDAASGRMTAQADWTGVDVGALSRLAAPAARLHPSARATGSMTAEGTGSDVAGWNVQVQSRLTAGSGNLPVDGTIETSLLEGRWTLAADAAVASMPLSARLEGRLDPARFAASTVSGTAALHESDLPALLDRVRALGLVETPPDALTGGRLSADATLSGTLERPRFDIRAVARNITTPDVTGVDADVTVNGTPQQMAVDAQLRQGTANSAMVAATIWPEEARLESRVSAALRSLADLVTGAPVSGEVELTATAGGPFDALTATGTALATGARYRQYELGPLDAAFDVTAETITVNATAPELNATARATVPREGMRRATISLDAANTDLARVLRGTSTPLPVTGTVSLSAQADVPFDDWRTGRAELDVTRLDARAGELPIRLAGPARLEYDGGIATVSALEADLGATRLSVAGRLPLSATAPPVGASDALRAALTGDASQVLQAAAATGLVDIPHDVSATGAVALLARVTGSAERPLLAADLDLSGGTLSARDLPAVEDVQLRAQLANGAIDLLTLSARWQDAILAAEGRMPLQVLEPYLPDAITAALPLGAGPATLTARATSITPRVLAPFLDASSLAQIEGAMDARLELSAAALDPAALAGEIRLDRLDVRVAGLPVTQRQPTRIAIENGIARVTAWDWTGQGATLAVQGEVRLPQREAALLAAGQLDLRILTPFVSDAGIAVAGTLAPRVSIFGALADPRIDGELALTGGEIRLREPRVIATDLNAFAVMTPSGGRTTALGGTVNGGALTGSASFEYGGAAPWSGTLHAAIDGMGLEFPEGLRSELSTDLTLSVRGSAAGPAGTLTGTVTVERSVYREPMAVVTGLLSALQNDRLAAGAAAPDAFARRLDLNVRVITDSDILVDNNLAQLELGGDLRVIGTAAQPALSGRAVLREGGQLFLGRNVYTVREPSTIDFANPVTVEPNLNVRATTRAGGYDIDLTLTGTPETLDVALDAPGTDLTQPDLASLLVTGRRLDDVPGNEAQIVGEQVLGYLTGDILGVAGSALGLDTLRLGGPAPGVRRDPTEVAAETDPTSRLTFGRDFGEAVELTYSQSLREGAATWIVDYHPFPQVDLRLVSRDDNSRSYEFRHNVEIGGGASLRRSARARTEEPDVAAVTVTGDAPTAEPELRRLIGIDAGDTFDVGDWLRARDRLERHLHDLSYLESRVTADRETTAGGIALTFDIRTGPRTAIEATGYSLPPATRAAIADAWTQSVFDDFLREEAAALVRQALAADGYLQPEVAVALTAGDSRTLSIAVTPGTRVTNRRLQIAADDEALARELEAWAAARDLDAQAWVDPSTFEDQLTAELRARGHLNATVSAAEPREERGEGTLVVTVAAGPRYTIGGVTFTGTAGLEEAVLRDAAALETGAPYGTAAIDAARDRVLRAYRREGFAAARVEVTPAVDASARTVAVGFAASPGRRDVLRAIEIAGNRSVDEDVIGRALALEVGEPLGAEAWLQARSRLFETALFRRVDVVAGPFEEVAAPAADTERPMRVVVTVQEWPALRLRYGLQLSEEESDTEIDARELSPGFSADVTRRTLFGRAVTVGAATELQRRLRLGRLFASAPMLAGLPIESVVSAVRSRETFTESAFVTDRSRVSFEQRLRISTPFRVSYSYSFERNHTFDTGPPDPIIGPFDLTVRLARISTAATFDTRDDPTDTTRGSFYAYNFEHAPTTLGSDVRFVRQTAQAYRFERWRDVVFGSAARLGLAGGHGGQEVIPSERFYVGGARSVRGVREDSLGPRNIFGEVAGGEAFVVLNQEVRFPLFWWFRGVGFVDAGNAFERPSAIDFSDFAVSAGAGLRVNTPLGLLRVDFAQPLRRPADTTESSGRWHFGIGHSF